MLNLKQCKVKWGQFISASFSISPLNFWPLIFLPLNFLAPNFFALFFICPQFLAPKFLHTNCMALIFRPSVFVCGGGQKIIKKEKVSPKFWKLYEYSNLKLGSQPQRYHLATASHVVFFVLLTARSVLVHASEVPAEAFCSCPSNKAEQQFRITLKQLAVKGNSRRGKKMF